MPPMTTASNYLSGKFELSMCQDFEECERQGKDRLPALPSQAAGQLYATHQAHQQEFCVRVIGTHHLNRFRCSSSLTHAKIPHSSLNGLALPCERVRNCTTPLLRRGYTSKDTCGESPDPSVDTSSTIIAYESRPFKLAGEKQNLPSACWCCIR